MRPLKIVKILPLLKLLIEEFGIINDNSLKHAVELLFINPMRSLHFLIQSWTTRFNVSIYPEGANGIVDQTQFHCLSGLNELGMGVWLVHKLQIG